MNGCRSGSVALRTLTLHRADTTVLEEVVSSNPPPERGWKWKTHSEEDPLKHLAIVSRLFGHVKPELVLGVIVLR